MIVITSVLQARRIALKHALHLEILGMKRRGRSAYAIIKEEFGLRGNKQKVYEQFCELLQKEEDDEQLHD